MAATDLSGLKAELQILAAYARERHEDAYTTQSLLQFLDVATGIPDWAWGTYEPWSKDWSEDWRRLTTNRNHDAVTLRDQYGTMASGLYQVVADYQQSDIDIALDFEAVDREVLKPFLSSRVPGTKHSGAYQPGVSAPVTLSDYTQQAATTTNYALGGRELGAIGQERPPSYTWRSQPVSASREMIMLTN